MLLPIAGYALLLFFFWLSVAVIVVIYARLMLLSFDLPPLRLTNLSTKQAREVLQEESNVQPVVCSHSPPGHLECFRAI